MKQRDRTIGKINLGLTVVSVCLLLVFPFTAVLASPLVLGVFGSLILAWIVAMFWTALNAVRYWRGEAQLRFSDHLLLGVGVLTSTLVLAGAIAFIVIGES